MLRDEASLGARRIPCKAVRARRIALSMISGDSQASAGAFRWGWRIAAGVVAVLAAVVWTWPLATALRSAVPTNRWHCLGDGCEDEFLCVWIVTALGQRLVE